MRLQLSFDLAVSIRHIGNLALIGMAEREKPNPAPGESKVYAVSTFMLVFRDDAPLAGYFNPLTGFKPGSLLYEIFVGEGVQVMKSASDEHISFLVFNDELQSKLESPRRLLHAVANRILRDLQGIEDNELSLLDMDDEMEWAEHSMIHPGRRGPMPNFKRPRHS